MDTTSARAWLASAVTRARTVYVRIAGHSQESREIPALVLSNSGHSRAADLRAVPACFMKAWTRPSSFGEAKERRPD